MARDVYQIPTQDYELVADLAPDESIADFAVTGVGLFNVPQNGVVLRGIANPAEVLVLTRAAFLAGGYAQVTDGVAS